LKQGIEKKQINIEKGMHWWRIPLSESITHKL
jgi:hypothetical protein